MPTETLERESVTKRTHDLLTSFQDATERVERARQDLNHAETALANARNALSRWLIPGGAKSGEQYNIWWGNQIVSVVVDGSGREGKVTIRTARAALPSSRETTE